jgi:hypothetical protein
MAEDKCRRAFQSDASNGFRSLSPRQFAAAKATARIPLCCRLTHQALVQAALDPDVVRIDFVESVAVREIDVPLGGIILVRGDGAWLLDLPDAQPTLDIDDAGSRELAIEQLAIPRLTIATAELQQEPCASNCSLVWSCRTRWVSPGDQVRILHYLEENGASPLITVAPNVISATDPIASVLALACRDLIELDLISAPLNPSTIVRHRRRYDGD